MNSPLVSVIVPVYNTPEPELRHCIDSILAQTLENIEIILVDDVSTDGSLDILKEYAKKDARIVLIQHEKNARVAVSRNTGIAAAKGIYLYLMDCDDWIEADTVEKTYQEAEKNQVDVLCFNGKVHFETEEVAKEFEGLEQLFHYTPKQCQVQSGLDLLRSMTKEENYIPMVWLLLMKREWYQRVGLSFYDVPYADDEVFYFEFLHKAEKVCCFNECFYHYCMRTGSGLTKKKNYDFISSLVRSYVKIYLSYEENKQSTLSREEFDQYFQNRMTSLKKNYLTVTGQEPTAVEETLENINHLLQGEPLVKKDTWADYRQKEAQGLSIAFFGAGLEGRSAVTLFKEQKFSLPLCICDNDKGKQGGFFEGIPILSLEEALNTYDNLHIIITNHKYYREIYQQLVETIGKKRIIYFCR